MWELKEAIVTSMDKEEGKLPREAFINSALNTLYQPY